MRAEARKGSGLIVADLVIHPDRAAAVFVETGGSGLAPRGFAARDVLPAGGGPSPRREESTSRKRRRAGSASSSARSARAWGDLRIRIQSPNGTVEDRLRPGPVSAPDPDTLTEKYKEPGD
jgi:hypothetical protein